MNSKELTEYSISVNVPDELRTRNAANVAIGASGLLELEKRTIDKLWYAVYYDNQLVKWSTEERNNENPFSATVKLEGNINPTKLFFFFWAGNKQDNVEINSSNINKSGRVNLNFNDRYVELGKAFYSMNPNTYDSFSKYCQFSTDPNDTNRTLSVTLKRPFAEIHVLSDDFRETDLKLKYTGGYKMDFGFGSENPTKLTDLKVPYIWHFDTNDITYKSIPSETSDYNFLNFQNFNFQNEDKYKVTFKGREMDYIGYLYVFAPIERSVLLSKTNESDTETLDRLNVCARTFVPNVWREQEYVSIPLPEEGLQANYKYIFYNKKRSEGGTGFLTGYYQYEIIADPDHNFDGTDQSENGLDRL